MLKSVAFIGKFPGMLPDFCFRMKANSGARRIGRRGLNIIHGDFVGRLHFVIDDVYRCADFIMLQFADSGWPRWMVVESV